MQLRAPSPLLLNKGRPSSPCYCHTACNLQGSQIGTRLCPAAGQHPRGTAQPSPAGGLRECTARDMHIPVLRGCARHTDLGNFFLQGMGSGMGQGLLCTEGKAAATPVQLAAGDTLGDWRTHCSCSVSSRSSRDSDTRSSLSYTETSAFQKKQCFTQYYEPVLLVIVSF